MKASKPKLLLCGDRLARDSPLHKLLRKIADVIVFRECEAMRSADELQASDLIIMEFSNDNAERELERLRDVHRLNPAIAIIVIDQGGSRNAVIETFKSGAKDYFKQPYDRNLLAERAEAMLSVQQAGK